MSIIISKSGAGATKIEKSALPHEDYLQDYVARNPQSLPMGELKDNLRLLVVGREFATNSGNIDVLAIDQDGDIYLIETKLFRNPDKRLVVAQVLDYGAALSKTYGDGAAFLQEVEGRILRSSGSTLDEQIQAHFDPSGEETTSLRGEIARNFERGHLRFVVLMDRLTDRLRDLIVFINEKSSFSIYAVEMDFYQHEGLEIVIPRLFGGEARKQMPEATIGSSRTRWEPDDFFAALAAATDNSVADFARQVTEQWKARPDCQVDWSKSSGPMFKFNDVARGDFFTLGGIANDGSLFSVERFFDRVSHYELPRSIFDEYADTLLRLIPGAQRTQNTTKAGGTREYLKFKGDVPPLKALKAHKGEWLAAMECAIAEIKKVPVL